MSDSILIFAGHIIHENAQESGEPFEEAVTNFVTACKSAKCAKSDNGDCIASI